MSTLIDHKKSPFKFLESYDLEDQNQFFGRAVEIEELYERVFAANFLLLYGASGTGKTSLVFCGLASQFEPTDWLPISIRREENMLVAMEEAIYANAIQPIDPSLPLRKKIRSLYLDHFKPIYLIFDQFEELFILGEKEEHLTFFEEIRDLLLAGLQCKIIISMREEYIAYLHDYEAIIPSLFDNRMRIERMNTVNLQKVINGSADVFDIEITPNATDLIIKSIQDKKKEVELANLQLYLDKLYREDTKRKNLSNRPYWFDEALIKDTGELEDVLADFLEEQLNQLEAELKEQGIQQKGIPLDVLFSLVTEDGTKKALEAQNIKKRLQDRKAISAKTIDYCIQRFNELRLIRILSKE